MTAGVGAEPLRSRRATLAKMIFLSLSKKWLGLSQRDLTPSSTISESGRRLSRPCRARL